MHTPGSKGEHELQKCFNTSKRANAFYSNQMLDHLNAHMRQFIKQQEMVFIATSDAHGECDCSFRAGFPGFIHTLNDQQLVYPEYRGNGIMASLGNLTENPHIGMMFIDFYKSGIGLHVNGKASILENTDLMNLPDIPEEIQDDLEMTGGRKPERWVWVQVEEAYIHCSKHIPILTKANKTIHWGTDKSIHKGGDFFKVKSILKQSDMKRHAVKRTKKIHVKKPEKKV